MILKLSNPNELKRFEAHAEYLKKHGKLVELREIRKKKTLAQNGYYQLITKWFSLETGYDHNTTKEELFKRTVNNEYFATQISGSVGTYIRYKSTSELNTKEMAECITRFRNWSASEAGVYLPEPNEDEFIRDIQNQIDKYQNRIVL